MTMVRAAVDALSEALEALEAMAYQHAYWSDAVGGLTTGGLSANEQAFEVLGWDDPQPMPELRCDEPGCLRRASVWGPSADGYRRTCGVHWPGDVTK